MKTAPSVPRYDLHIDGNEEGRRTEREKMQAVFGAVRV